MTTLPIPNLFPSYQAGGVFPIYDAFPRVMVASGAAITANQEYCIKMRFPIVDRITALEIYVTTQSGNVTLGIRDCVDLPVHTTASTLDLRATTADTAMGAANAVQRINLATPLGVRPNKDYWLTLISNNTGSLGRMPAIALFMQYNLMACQKAIGSYTLGSSVATWGSGSLTPWIAAVGSRT